MDKLDIKLWTLASKGQIVPDRSLLKTPEQIQGIRDSSVINIAVLDEVAKMIKPGVSTEEIDRLVYDVTTRMGGIPAPLNYEGFPKSVCTSIDEVVCHGIPSPDRILKEGEIVNVDVSTIYKGYFSDSSRMFCIGEVSEEKKKLVQVTKECVELGLEQVSDEGAIAAIVDEVLAENPQSVADYKAGKDKAIGFLVGQVMKKSRGKANPGMVNKLLKEKMQ